ncbi:MAG: hypothetical protein ACRCZS_30085 [Chroococcidiopsis sp.]
MASRGGWLMKHGSIVSANPSIILASKRHYRGAAPYPYTPSIGDTWEELSATGLWIEAWFWNGTYWLSQQTFEKYQVNSNSINSGTGAGLAGYGFTVDFNFNLYVLNMQAAIYVSNATTSTNYWSWDLTRISSVSGSITLASADNRFQAGNTWKAYLTNINTHINLALTQTTNLRIREGATGGSATKMGTIGYQYKLARI